MMPSMYDRWKQERADALKSDARWAPMAEIRRAFNVDRGQLTEWVELGHVKKAKLGTDQRAKVVCCVDDVEATLIRLARFKAWRVASLDTSAPALHERLEYSTSGNGTFFETLALSLIMDRLLLWDRQERRRCSSAAMTCLLNGGSLRTHRASAPPSAAGPQRTGMRTRKGAHTHKRAERKKRRERRDGYGGRIGMSRNHHATQGHRIHTLRGEQS